MISECGSLLCNIYGNWDISISTAMKWKGPSLNGYECKGPVSSAKECSNSFEVRKNASMCSGHMFQRDDTSVG
jgi:hypothetical protein